MEKQHPINEMMSTTMEKIRSMMDANTIIGDPGDAAIRYGQANALLGSIWQPLTEAFHVEEGRARVEVDFTAAAPVLTGQVSLSLKLYQLLWLGLHFGLRALSTYVNHRNRHKQQREAV